MRSVQSVGETRASSARIAGLLCPGAGQLLGALLLAAAALPGCRTSASRAAPFVPPVAQTTPQHDAVTDPGDDGSLVSGLYHADPAVRATAARGLANRPAAAWPDPAAAAAAIDALHRRLREESEAPVLVELLFALGQHGHRPAAADCAALLGPDGHPAPEVREQAALALGRLADDAYTHLLSLRLSDNEAAVRGAAALALLRLDGRRYDHARSAGGAVLQSRDSALAAAARHDPDAGVRWRATCALAGLRGQPGFATVLAVALGDEEPLVRVFALRGLAELRKEGFPGHVDWPAALRDPDPRVACEAARSAPDSLEGEALGALTEALIALIATPGAHGHALVRAAAAETLGRLLLTSSAESALWLRIVGALAECARRDPAPTPRRAAARALIAGPDEGRALYFLRSLAHSRAVADRVAAAEAIGAGPWAPGTLLDLLLADRVPAVAAAALRAEAAALARARPGETPFIGPGPARQPLRTGRLAAALLSGDPALVATAAEVVAPDLQQGYAAPQLLHAAVVAHSLAVGPELKEARMALRTALQLPADTEPPRAAAAPRGRLLDRLLAQASAAAADPAPQVSLVTAKGELRLELDRRAAPRHVASFLELAAAGLYDGLDFHRVVPNFVAQGLDPRGDGWGTAGRRLPDEFSPLPFVTGTLGMPHAGEPHGGGCQIFLTHIPTPHLDGRYTVFGRVLSGHDLLLQLEVGDRVTRVRRLEADPADRRPRR